MNKSKRIRLIKSASLCALAASMLIPVSCGNKDKKGKIALIAKQEMAFWDDVREGAEKAGEELGYDIIYYVGNSSSDYETQSAAMRTSVDDGVDAIILAANTESGAEADINHAIEEDIPVIGINSKTKGAISTFISSSDIDAGAIGARKAMANLETFLNGLQVEQVADQVSGSEFGVGRAGGSVLIVAQNASTAQDRVDGFKSEAVTQLIQALSQKGGLAFKEKMGEFTQTEIMDKFASLFKTIDKIGSEQEAYDAVTAAITSPSDNTKVLFATNTYTTIGATKAVMDAGKGEQIHIIGFNADPEEITYLNNGMIEGLVVQNPYNMGYISVRYAKKVIDGENVPASVDTGVTYVNSQNYNEEYVQMLLYPENY